MQKFFLIATIFLLSFFIFNCASSTVGVAPSNKPIPNLPYETIKSVDKTFTWYSIDLILLSFSTSTPPTEKIYSEMMKDEEADAVVNIRYFNEKSVFGFIVRHRFGIKGDLIKLTAAVLPPIKGKK